MKVRLENGCCSLRFGCKKANVCYKNPKLDGYIRCDYAEKVFMKNWLKSLCWTILIGSILVIFIFALIWFCWWIAIGLI